MDKKEIMGSQADYELDGAFLSSEQEVRMC